MKLALVIIAIVFLVALLLDYKFNPGPFDDDEE